MTTKVAINGFGRIGRLVLRALIEQGRDDIEIVAINDLGPVETNAHLMRFDSVHGRLPVEVTSGADWMDVGRGRIRATAIRNPAELPWSDVDVVMECTGIFSAADKARIHLENGASRVLVSAPSNGADATIVYGVNQDTLKPEHRIVSNASCTTNCLAPVAKVLHDSVGITRGFMTTIHSYTGDQPTLDTMHKDLYRARAAAMSMIPTSTDLTFEASRATTIDEINAALSAAASGPLNGVLGVTAHPNVSIDFNHDPRSSVVALDNTRVMDGTMVRILSWYDNEWGFSNRMLDTAAAIGKLG